MRYTSIKVDGAFPTKMETVEAYLESGWHIVDKTILDNRYIIYILAEHSDPDVGKCSYSATNSKNI